ncbi:MAG: hypothetical protein AAB975_04165 [Patescibacteria group bacterium]
MEDHTLSPLSVPPVQSSGGNASSFYFNKWKVLVGFAALLVIGGMLVYFIAPSQLGVLSRREFSQTFTLVQDKVSQSAAIVISLPAGISVNTAEASGKISFEPVLQGEWTSGKDNRELIFKPKSKLALGTYYTVALAAEGTEMQKDFYVDEDPKVVSVFPHADSQAPEKSDITIVFNRPMVPLTTLDTLLEKDIPIEVTPATQYDGIAITFCFSPSRQYTCGVFFL